MENYLSDLENEKRNYQNIYPMNYVIEDINVEKIISILVNWMIEVQEEFELKDQTLYLAVNYMDRVLKCLQIPKFAIQLLGITCLFIASKYEEIYPPDISKFLFVCDSTYNKDQVIGMEYKILTALKFQLTCVSLKNFFSFYWNVLEVDEDEKEIRDLCFYLGELTLPVYEFRKYLPSKVAASIVCLSVYLCSQNRIDLKYWSTDFEKYTQYKKEDLRDCVQLLYQHYKDPSQSSLSVVEKYNSPKYGKIQNLKLPKILPF